jgi:hypothetical protein
VFIEYMLVVLKKKEKGNKTKRVDYSPFVFISHRSYRCVRYNIVVISTWPLVLVSARMRVYQCGENKNTYLSSLCDHLQTLGLK